MCSIVLKAKYDFVLARAVTRLNKLIPLTFHLISDKDRNALPNGLLALKGGDLREEIKEVSKHHHVDKHQISDSFQEPYFEEKYLLYLQK